MEGCKRDGNGQSSQELPCARVFEIQVVLYFFYYKLMIFILYYLFTIVLESCGFIIKYMLDSLSSVYSLQINLMKSLEMQQQYSTLQASIGKMRNQWEEMRGPTGNSFSFLFPKNSSFHGILATFQFVSVIALTQETHL